MDKIEILKFLADNIECFEDVTIDDFYELSTIDTEELGSMNKKVSSLTPLLKQICNYALIAAVVDGCELSDIADCFYEDDILKNNINIIENCFQYVEILQQENCHHPSILAMINLINGLTVYTNFLEIIDELIELTEDEFQDDLIDFGTMIDDRLDEIREYLFENLINRIKKGIVTNEKELLTCLSNYTKNYLNTILLLSKNNNLYQQNENHISCFENIYINTQKRNDRINKESSLTLLKAIESFGIIIQKAEDYITYNFYDMDSDIETLIGDLKEAYILYESYKYKVLKDNYKEQKLLEKCNKM